MQREVKDWKPCFIGLEPFFYPKKVGDQRERNKAFLKKMKKDIMIGYWCSIHNEYFWRNKINKKGKCNFCRLFNSKIHFSLFSEKYKKECEDMKVKQSVSLEAGKYTGEIVDVTERKEPYEYTDFIIKVEGVELSCGYPSGISVNKEGKATTGLAKVLNQFGMEFKVDQEVTMTHIKETVMNKKVAILVENEETEKGTFAKIVSMKPAK